MSILEAEVMSYIMSRSSKGRRGPAPIAASNGKANSGSSAAASVDGRQELQTQNQCIMESLARWKQSRNGHGFTQATFSLKENQIRIFPALISVEVLAAGVPDSISSSLPGRWVCHFASAIWRA